MTLRGVVLTGGGGGDEDKTQDAGETLKLLKTGDDLGANLEEVLSNLKSTMTKHMMTLTRINNDFSVPTSLAVPQLHDQKQNLLDAKTPGGGGGEEDRKPSIADQSRPEKTTVLSRIVFVKLGEIDTLKDRFTGEAVITSRWRERTLDGKRGLKPSSIDWNQYWSPKLFVKNAIGELKESINTTVEFDSNGRAVVVETRKINGTFYEVMELNQFPFDTQDITITLTTERLDKEVEIIEDPKTGSALSIQSFSGEQEWHLHECIHVYQKIRIDENKTPKTKHSSFSTAGKVSRRPGFFIWNILIVMFLICTLEFTTFAVDLNLPQNRIQLSFILLLTTVSFKFVVNASMPMISYLTYMDYYILISMGILVLTCVWHAVAPVINGTPPSGFCCTDFANWIDNIALVILGGFYISFQTSFILIVTIVTKMVKDDVAEVIAERAKEKELAKKRVTDFDKN